MEFNRNICELKCRDVPLINNIFDFTVFEGNKPLYKLGEAHPAISDKTANGTRLISIGDALRGFSYQLQFAHKLAENRVTATFEYELPNKDMRISCNVASLAANPFLGREYHYKDGKQGVIPLEFKFVENAYKLDDLLGYDTSPKIHETDRHLFKSGAGLANDGNSGGGIEINSPMGMVSLQALRSSPNQPLPRFSSKRNFGWTPNDGSLVNWSFGRGAAAGKQSLEVEFLLTPSAAQSAPTPAARAIKEPELVENVTQAEEGIMVVPEPQQMTKGGKDNAFQVDKDTLVVVGDHCAPEDLTCAEILRDELKDAYHVPVAIRKAGEVRRDDNVIVVGEPWLNPLSDKLCGMGKIAINQNSPGAEGYVLRAGRRNVLVAGSDRRGTFYGVQTLLQLIKRQNDAKVAVPAVDIRDWPDIKMRGLWIAGISQDIAWDKKFIEKVIAGGKMNTLIIMVDHYMRFDSHPEINAHEKSWLSPEQWRDLLAFAQSRFVEIIPHLKTFNGQSDGLFDARNKDRHLELAEVPASPQAVCLSNPAAYQLFHDLMDDVVALFHPKHIETSFCDETTQIGVCEKCKQHENYQNYASGLIKIHGFLAGKGITLAMFANDLLGPDEPELFGVHECNGGGSYFGARKNTSEALGLIPKDIIMNPWHYPMPGKYGSFGYLGRKGFQVWAMPWFHIKNIYPAALAAKDANCLGFISFNSNFIKEAILGKEISFLPGMVLTGEYGWSAGKPSLGDIPDTYPTRFHFDPYPERKRVARMMNRLVDTPCPAAAGGFLVDLSSYCNMGTEGWFGYGSGYDLRAFPVGKHYLGGTLFDTVDPKRNGGKAAIALKGAFANDQRFPERVDAIKIGKKAASLTFLHTAGWGNCFYWAGDAPLYKTPEVGSYVIRYSDGAEEKVKLVEKVNIEQCYAQEWYDLVDVMLTPPFAKIAWEGKTKAGCHATIYSYEWVNPFPEKVIKEVDFVSTNTIASPVLLAITGKTTAKAE